MLLLEGKLEPEADVVEADKDAISQEVGPGG